MKKLILFILISAPSWGADPLFTTTTYYMGLGERFRVETASSWPKCKESKKARKIFLAKTDELREVAYWDEKGIHEAGKDNNPHVHKVVNEIFARSQVSGNPCEVPEENEGESAKGSAQ